MCLTRYIFGRKYVLCGVLPLNLSNNNEQSEKTSIFDHERNTVTGLDRLYHMFSVDEVGSFSREILSSFQATIFGAFTGATYGALKSMTPPEVEGNDKLALKNKFHARNSVAGKEYALNFVKGTINWGWRVGLFCGTAVLVSSTTSVYRGKTGVLEYSVTGGIIGTAVPWKRGLRAMGLGGLIGTIIGTAAGCVMYAVNTVGGTTTEEARFWQYGWKEAQLKHTKERLKQLKEESTQLVEHEKRETVTSAKL